jgi:hypothetical protein
MSSGMAAAAVSMIALIRLDQCTAGTLVLKLKLLT